MLARIKTVALSAMIALGAFAAAPATANAGDLRVQVHFGGPGYYHGHDRHYRPSCRPARALRKARNMGLRHAWIARHNANRIVVKGTMRGHHRSIVFAKAPGCPVRNWR